MSDDAVTPQSEDKPKARPQKSTKKSAPKKTSSSSSASSDPKYKDLLERAVKLLDTRHYDGHELNCKAMTDPGKACQCNVDQKQALVAEIRDYL